MKIMCDFLLLAHTHEVCCLYLLTGNDAVLTTVLETDHTSPLHDLVVGLGPEYYFCIIRIQLDLFAQQKQAPWLQLDRERDILAN